MKVLIIEPEKHLQRSILENLEQDGITCEAAGDCSAGIEKSTLYNYDCVIADISNPATGFDLLKSIRGSNSNCGVIVISSSDNIDIKLTCFHLGADDYITKPLHLSELNARTKAVARRRWFDESQVITLNEIQIFPDEFKVLANGEELKLTRGEYKLLLYMVSKKNRVVTKTALAELLWGDQIDQADSYDFVYSHIKNLRKRLTEKGCSDYIKTIYGIGYNFKVN